MVLDGAHPSLVTGKTQRVRPGTQEHQLVLGLEGFLEELALKPRDMSQEKGVPEERELRAKENWRERGTEPGE